jgi:hypothetical protein
MELNKAKEFLPWVIAIVFIVAAAAYLYEGGFSLSSTAFEGEILQLTEEQVRVKVLITDSNGETRESWMDLSNSKFEKKLSSGRTESATLNDLRRGGKILIELANSAQLENETIKPSKVIFLPVR